MQFVEFLECCARIADKFSPVPYYEDDVILFFFNFFYRKIALPSKS